MNGETGARTIAVTSGKGGVGKTNLSVNLALALAEQGCRTCLLDADLGLANVNVLLGLEVGANLEDVILGRAGLADIMIKGCHGIDIIPGSSGVQRMADLGDRELEALLESFSALPGYDFFLMDTSAGISRNVIAFCMAASEVILVLLPEPASMTDAYALLKVLDGNGFKGVVKVVVSQCKNISAARKCYTLLRETTDRYLGIRVALAGVVISDQKVAASIGKRVPVIKSHPECNASRCIRHLAKTLLQQGPACVNDGGLPGFWTRFLGILKAPMELGGREEGGSSGMETARAPGGEDPPLREPPDHLESAAVQDPHDGRLVSALGVLSQELAELRSELRRLREELKQRPEAATGLSRGEDHTLDPPVFRGDVAETHRMGRGEAGVGSRRTPLDDIIRTIEQIPTLPAVSKKILEVREDDPCAFRKYAGIIGKDQALALRILKLANSALYGAPGRVGSLEDALVRLGTREVKPAVLGFTVQGFFSTETSGVFDRKRFWKHAVVCSQAAKSLSIRYRVEPGEWMFLIGLIHDVGKAVVDAYLHEDFLRILDVLHSGRTTFSRAEKLVLGTTHYQIGAKVLKQWGFPAGVFLPVLHHHAPWDEHEYQEAAALVYLSDLLAKMAGYPSHVDEKDVDPDTFVSSPEARFLARKGFDLDQAALQRLISEVKELIRPEGGNMMDIID